MHSLAGVIALVGLLVFLAHLFTALFSRTKLPDVLMLILVGLLLGPVTGIIRPEHFGAIGPLISTIALVVILFEGGIGLRLHDLRKTFGGVLGLTVATFLATVAVSAVIAYSYTGLGLYGSFLLGSVLGATSPAVVIPLTKQLKMKPHARTVLTMESAISEVLCIVLVMAFLEAYQPGALDVGRMLGRMIASFVVASLFGVGTGLMWSSLLHKVRTLENSLFTTPAFVFVVYGIVEGLGYNGAIAALAFGITLGNIRFFNKPSLRKFVSDKAIEPNRTEKIFFSEFVFLLKTFFFFYVGISMQFTDPRLLVAGVIITAAIYILRIPAVRLTVDHNKNTVGEASVMAVMVPKGLASAVVAALPLQMGFPEGEPIQGLTYSVVLLSIMLTSALIFLLDKSALGRAYGWVYTGFKASMEPLGGTGKTREAQAARAENGQSN